MFVELIGGLIIAWHIAVNNQYINPLFNTIIYNSVSWPLKKKHTLHRDMHMLVVELWTKEYVHGKFQVEHSCLRNKVASNLDWCFPWTSLFSAWLPVSSTKPWVTKPDEFNFNRNTVRPNPAGEKNEWCSLFFGVHKLGLHPPFSIFRILLTNMVLWT